LRHDGWPPTTWGNGSATAASVFFGQHDRDHAHGEDVKDKPHLLVVPTGALTSLPFHLLVTEKPSTPVPQVEDIATYRDAAWLVKRQAVTVLPSVVSLQALRVFARNEQAAKPMVGRRSRQIKPTRVAQRVDAHRSRPDGSTACACSTREGRA
jgi:CHAT domain